jgi:biopolymer transport protein ExbB
MAGIYYTFLAGGFVMWPLLGLFIATFACVLERSWFWFKLIIQEKHVVHEVLTAAKVDLEKAQDIAQRSQGLAIGRFFLAPLKLKRPSPENFYLAMKVASDREFIDMYQGDQLLKSVMAIAPLLGILGTAGGLLTTFHNLKNGDIDSTDVSAVVTGISQALITSVTGITVAIIAFIFFRIFVGLRSRQKDYFSKVGSELELIYLQAWHDNTNATNIPITHQKFNTGAEEFTNTNIGG